MPGDGVHWEQITYDEYGRTYQTFDAARDTDDFSDNVVQNVYNAQGYLQQIVDGAYLQGSPRKYYYDIQKIDARGQVTEAILGNGVTQQHQYNNLTGRIDSIRGIRIGNQHLQDLSFEWDKLGNLDNREDNGWLDENGFNRDLRDEFQYDALNRLRFARTYEGGALRYTQETRFDSLGNISYKSDVGNYSYGSDSLRPHAVTQAGGVSYQYDANGNNYASSDGRTLAYTTFDKPSEIIKGNSKVEFAYGPSHARYKRIDTDTSSNRVTETLYLGSVEKITHFDGSQEYKRYIGGVLVISQKPHSTGSGTITTESYLLKDHLGSVNLMLDENGTILQAVAFDPWGKRRNSASWDAMMQSAIQGLANNYSTLGPLTTRGYTGHEMLDEVGLIHMNGRIYDARLARFLQADPFIDGVTYTQGHNRYSYTHNNPLNATDPSGHLVFTLTAIAYTALAEGVTWYAAGAIFAAAGFADAMIQGASFNQALKTGVISGISGAAFSAIGASGWDFVGGDMVITQSLAYGVVGGITSTLQGGKFGHGFISAGLSGPLGGGLGKLLKPALAGASQIVARMVVGGTLSDATGGKFANGAAFAAFAAVVNAGSGAGNGDAAQEESFQNRFQKITGMSVEDSISLYEAQTGESLTVNQVEKLFTDPEYANEQLMASENLHKVYRGILNSNIPQTSAGAQSAGYTKLVFLKSLFHDPINNSKWVGPSGNMEGVYSRRSGTIDVSRKYGGTFNFYGPSNASAHKLADVDPYLKWGN